MGGFARHITVFVTFATTTLLAVGEIDVKAISTKCANNELRRWLEKRGIPPDERSTSPSSQRVKQYTKNPCMKEPFQN